MTNIEPTEQPKTMDLETAQRVEREKMTRRAALRKLGYGAGIAAFSMLGVDDFARMAGSRMAQMAGDNKVATRVAKEFQEAGIANAFIANVAQSPSQVGVGYGKQCATTSIPVTCLQQKCLSTYDTFFHLICGTDCQACEKGGGPYVGGGQ